MDLTDAEALDAAYPLASLRDEFVVANDDLVYLDGNSLGMLPRAALDRVLDVVHREWGARPIRSWNEGWYDAPRRVGDAIGRHFLGAAPGQVVVADSSPDDLICLNGLSGVRRTNRSNQEASAR